MFRLLDSQSRPLPQFDLVKERHWRLSVGNIFKERKGKSIPKSDFCKKTHLECVRVRHSETRKEEEVGWVGGGWETEPRELGKTS